MAYEINYITDPTQKGPVDFYRNDIYVSRLERIKVPANWQLDGYGVPNYVNMRVRTLAINYCWRSGQISITHRHLTNVDFELPADWQNKQVFAYLGASEIPFIFGVNLLIKSAIHKTAKSPAEFDYKTDYVQAVKTTRP